MASKKILLEVLTTDRNRMAPAPPRPKKEKEERRREKPARASRPLSLPHPTTQSLLLVLSGVVAVVVSYGLGFWRGRRAESTPPNLSTSVKAPDLLDQVRDEPVAPKTLAAPAPATETPAKTEAVRYGVQLVSYNRSPRNEELAKRTSDELQKLGLPNVMAWQEGEKSGGGYFLTVGSFASKDDPALAALLERVKEMPFGKEKAPFAGA